MPPKSRFRHTAVIGALYLAQSIPVLLVGSALPPILRKVGVDLATIGALGLLLIPWAFKFAWAPLVDRGRRRAWILGAQIVVLTSLFALSRIDPSGPALTLFAPLVVLSFACGTQDIAVDGYAVEHLPPERHAAGGAIQAGAGAAGIVLGGAMTLVVYEWAGWQTAILGAAVLSALATLPILLVREGENRRRGVPSRRHPSIRQFFRRPGAMRCLALGALFRLPDGMLSAAARPFLVDQGLTLSRLGGLYGGTGAVLGLAGAVLSALAIRRLGFFRFLLAVIALRAAIQAAFAATALDLIPAETVGASLAVAHAVSSYVETAGLYALFLRAASLAQAATDFSLLSSGAALSFAAGSALAGLVSEGAGYPAAFLTGALLCLLGGGLGLSLVRDRAAPPALRD